MSVNATEDPGAMSLTDRDRRVFDVIVVGGGPAGSTAAYHLAESGALDVLVVDKSEFPRHKTCGGALVSCRDWSRDLPNYGEVEADLGGHPNEHVKICVGHALWWEGRGTHFFDQVSRSEFDDRLLQVALARPGVSFRVFRVRSVERTDDGIIRLSDGVDSLLTRAVVGADGVLSVVSRALGNPPRTANQAGACLEHELVCEKPHDTAHVFFLWDAEPGYCWIFPTRNGYNVGAGFLGSARRRVRQLFRDFNEFSIERGLLPPESERAESFGALAPATVVGRVADEGILLVGDAAGLLSQLSGEGIYYAMKSGQAAGLVLSAGLHGAAGRYRREIQPVIGEVTYLRTLRPRLLAGALQGYFGLSGAAARSGLGSALQRPLLNRMFRRRRLAEASLYSRLR